MNWGRERLTDEDTVSGRNFHRNPRVELFEYDSADLPFSPPTRNTGYLESGLPYWRDTSSINASDKFLSPSTQTSSDQQYSPLLKFSTSGSRSNENVNSELGPRPTISISLPATPLSTPGPTPLTTPVPTPHSSPSLTRKGSVEMEAVCKMATKDSVANAKWFYLGYRSNQMSSSEGNEQSSVDDFPKSHSSIIENVSKIQDFRPLSYLQKRALAISNRDMNFLAPTSM